MTTQQGDNMSRNNLATVHTIYQGRHPAETAGGEYRSMPRHRPAPTDLPVFARPDDAEIADMTPADARVRRTFLLGPTPGGAAVARANPSATSLYLEGHHPVARFGTQQTTYAASWFGDGDYSMIDCQRVWRWLTDQIRQVFRAPNAGLYLTPGTTGRDLWARTIPAEGFPVLSAEVQSLLRSMSGQGRIETMRAPSPGAQITGLHEYDARIAYVALLRDLPCGEPDLMTRAEARACFATEPYRSHRYLVEWRAPFDWDHVGILAERDDRGGWRWPMASSGPTWVTGAELWVANRYGWSVDILAGLRFLATAGPLDLWRNRLLRVLSSAEATLPIVEYKMVRSAVRGILLHTIGSFVGAPHKTTRTGPADQIPEGATGIRNIGSAVWMWREMTAPAWPEMIHPEWTGTIYGRARARLLYGHQGATGVLTLDPSTVVALRTDAVFTTTETHWERHDRGNVGQYRHNVYPDAVGPWPINGTDLLGFKS